MSRSWKVRTDEPQGTRAANRARLDAQRRRRRAAKRAGRTLKAAR